MTVYDIRVYEHPGLRPCAVIAPEATDGIKVGLHDLYDPLTRMLPLQGGGAMAPTVSGGIALCDRLRSHLPWMEPAIGLVERQLRVASWAGRPWLAWRPFCLVGDPGVGKSRLAREIGRLSSVPHAALDVGAMHDAAALVMEERELNQGDKRLVQTIQKGMGAALRNTRDRGLARSRLPQWGGLPLWKLAA